MNESPRFQGQERSNNPEMFAELGKAIAEQWKNISEVDHQRYKDLAAQDMERYSREMSEYRLIRAKCRLRDDEQGAAATRPFTFAVDRLLAPNHNEETDIVAALRSSGSIAPAQGQDFGLASIRPGQGFGHASQMGRDALLHSVHSAHTGQLGLMGHQDSASLLLFRSPRQEQDDIAAEQALRIRHLENVIARQQQQQVLQQVIQHASSVDWAASAAQVQQDRLVHAIFGDAPNALTINRGSMGLPNETVFAANAAAAAASSAWGRSLYSSGSPLPFSFNLAAALSSQPSAHLQQQIDEDATRALYRRVLSEQQQQQRHQQQQEPPRPPQRENDQNGASQLLLQHLLDRRSNTFNADQHHQDPPRGPSMG
jgi:hypothetical protein